MASFDLSKIKAKIKGNKIIQYLLICVLSILIIILLSVIFNNNDGNLQKSDIEKTLETALEKIDGIDDVSVLIGYVDTEKQIAYTTVTEKVEGATILTKTPYLINGDVVVLKEPSQEISGVIVVVDGVNNIATKIKIQNVVTTFLDVDLNLVEIVGAK